MKMSRGTYEALNVSSFLALDIETTGLDPLQDEIIEIGIVRMECGEITSRYSQLVNPQRPIPRFITNLTGIDTQDCQDQPIFEEIIPEISKQIGHSLVVMHNAEFDYGFLKNNWKKSASQTRLFPPTQILDTLTLSRLLFPYNENHRLSTLAEFFQVPVNPNHRAMVDAETTAHVFHGCLSHVLGLDMDTLQSIHRILDGAQDGLRLFLNHVIQFAETHYPGKKRRKTTQRPSNILGKPIPLAEISETQKIDKEEIKSYFSQTGYLSQKLNPFEYRAPQDEMAQFISRRFNQNEIAVVEAGTGVGKSLAYLVPAVLWVLKNPQSRVVLSTQTKTLQDQLFSKEIPLLQSMSSKPFQAVILKGRSNYLCLRKWNELLNDLDVRLAPNQRSQILPLISWISETQTGDIEENSGFHKEKNHSIWLEIRADAADCAGTQCAFEKECFYQKIRRASKKANLIVVNHSLLFSDLISDYNILGEYDTLIIDEAHQMEKIASQAFDKVLNIWRFFDFCHSLYDENGRNRGLISNLEQLTQDLESTESAKEQLHDTLKKMKPDVLTLKQNAVTLFTLLSDYATATFPKGYRKKRLENGNVFFDPYQSEIDNVRTSLLDVIRGLQKCVDLLPEITSTMVPLHLLDGLAYTTQQGSGLKELFDYFTEGVYEDNVVWCEQPNYLEHSTIYLHSVPLTIAATLSEDFYPSLKRVVLTSATLTVADSFDYIQSRLGLDSKNKDKVVCKAFGSPFEYSQQTLFLIPTFLDTPKQSGFVPDVYQLLKKIIPAYSRGTLILFTSHQMLQDVYEKLNPVLDEEGIHLFGQGIDGSRYQLLKMFQANHESVLLGTGSFWEGIDVPGSALEMLVMTRIPFDAPTDPLVEARMNQVQNETGNGFINFNVPEAVIRFRQGFGRLIRSGQDRGVVLILDRRIATHQYGTYFQESIPTHPIICKNMDELTMNLDQWFKIEKKAIEAIGLKL